MIVTCFMKKEEYQPLRSLLSKFGWKEDNWYMNQNGSGYVTLYAPEEPLCQVNADVYGNKVVSLPEFMHVLVNKKEFIDPYYKVISCYKGKYYSFNIEPHARACWPNSSLEYAVGQVTLPKIPNSKLFVFKTLKDATNFLRCTSSFYTQTKFNIFTCKVTNPVVGKVIFKGSDTDIKNAWNGQVFREYPAPQGTYYADSVELVESVDF